MIPGSLFARLVLLLGGVLAANTLIGLGLLGASTHDVTLRYSLRVFEARIFAADTLLAAADRSAAEARLRALDIEHRAGAPVWRTPLRPLHREIEAALVQALPGRELHVVEAREPMLWVAAKRAEDGWIGVPLLALRGPLWWSSTLAVAMAVLLVFAAAAWAARSLLRPLDALAAAAPRLLAGEAPPALPGHAAREIVALADAFERAAAQTRIAAQERQLMLAGLSHDMRTPLSRLLLALELLDTCDGEQIRAGMRDDIAELDAILGQFIAFVRDGRDEAGERVDLGALLDAALAAQRRSGRHWQRDGEATIEIHGKPLALRRAIDNLLDNAARHGAAPFAVELRRDGDGASLYVRDRGAGVDAGVLQHLGRPFYRADNARTTPGSGLGLASAARVAAWHGGGLELRNRDGGGFEAQWRIAGGAG